MADDIVSQTSPRLVAAAQKNGKLGGRPRKTIDKIALICALISDGYTLEEVAGLLKIDRQSLWRWRRTDKRLSNACKRARSVWAERVEHALIRRAVGSTVPEEVVSNCKNLDGTSSPVVTTITKHFPADPVSMIFALKNLRPAGWADRHEVGMTVEHTVDPKVLAGARELARERAMGVVEAVVVAKVEAGEMARD